jgi:hypothetical protein
VVVIDPDTEQELGGIGPPQFPDDANQAVIYDQSGLSGGAGTLCIASNVCSELPAETTCDDGIDNDCDGLIDAEDVDDCDGGPPVCEPTEPTEVTCSDGLDNDCDGAIDGDDPDCQGQVDCSQYGDRNSCRADNSCRWNNKDGECVPK